MSQPFPPRGQQPLPQHQSVGVMSYQPLPHVLSLQPTLPVEPREYHTFWQAPRLRWWKPLVVLLLTAVAFAIVSVIAGIAGVLWSGQLEAVMRGELTMTAELFLANNIALALSIPIAVLAQWWIIGQRPQWLSSVDGGFRWGWFGRCCAVILPVWGLLMGIGYLIAPPTDLQMRPHTWLLIIGILLTTPFQAAGEEYLIRGLLTRIVGAWIRPQVVSLVVAGVVSAAVFAAMHGAGDIWLNIYYFLFGLGASYMVWRTGGLEAAVAMHIVNNMLAEVTMPFSDISGMFDREAGTADASILINGAVIIGVALLLAWMAKKRGIVTKSAPGQAELETARQMPLGPGFDMSRLPEGFRPGDLQPVPPSGTHWTPQQWPTPYAAPPAPWAQPEPQQGPEGPGESQGPGGQPR